MKLMRLIQPRSPLFWIILVLNGLSLLLVWVVQNQPLNTLGVALVASFALINAVLGSWLAWRLVRTEAEPVSPDADLVQ